MNVKALISLLLLTPSLLWAQGFAGLGQGQDGFSKPEPGYVFSFPKDHGPHPDFRIEWWYLTANLQDESGRDLGIQWTLFRSATEPFEQLDWQSPQFWLAHAAMTTPNAHYHAEKLSRGGIGQAGVIADPFDAWIDDWQMAGSDFDQLSLRANGDGFSYDLALTANGPLVFQGDHGYSVKSSQGQASYYYSQPHYQVSGHMVENGQMLEVTGTAWLDREWSSQPLAADQSGWDWFSLNFDDGSKLMGFVLRGETGDFTSGTWIDDTGLATPLPHGAFRAKPVAHEWGKNTNIPTTWNVKLPQTNVDISVTALNPGSWMDTRFAYWEGPVQINGSHSGRGYLEMTGYPE